MKVALCLSGQPRGLKESFYSIKEKVIDINNCDVFAHVWIDESVRGKPFRKDVLTDIFCEDTENFILENYKPKKYTFEAQKYFEKEYRDSHRFSCYNPITNPRPSFNIQSMFYSILKSNELKSTFENENNFKYDCVIRCRFDYTFSENFEISLNDLEYLHTKSDCKHTFYAINDHIAYSNSENMNVYSNVFNHLQNYYALGIEFNPEVLLGYHITKSKIKVKKSIKDNASSISSTKERKDFIF
jgi:hypothetical protein